MDLPKFVKSRIWTLQRFGLTPEKLWARLINRDEPKILCISVPKSGTHLLERALCLHPKLYRAVQPTIDECNLDPAAGLDDLLAGMRAGQVIMSHLFFTAERQQAIARHNVRCIFMIRDPRDIAVSEASYLASNTGHRFHAAYSEDKDTASRILRSIHGSPETGLPSSGQLLDGLQGWLDSACMVVRFEDLIGPEGGGDLARQLSTLRDIYRHIGLPVEDGWIHDLRQRLFSSASPTFRQGRTGQWRQQFDAQITLAFKQIAGDGLIRYGYEKDEDWSPE